MDKRRLLIVDSCDDFVLTLAQLLQEEYDVRCCEDGREAVTEILEFHPHILVLELMLPNLDGIGLLEAVAAKGELPVSLTISRMYNEYSLQALHRLNVGYTMRKPCEIRAVADRIQDLDHMTLCHTSVVPDPTAQTIQTLLSLGFIPKHLGYAYLQQAILSIAQNPQQSFTKEIYPAIAAEHNCDQSSVEHAIRTSIASAWKKGDTSLWLRYFPQDTGKASSRPTNSTFITRLASELKLKK